MRIIPKLLVKIYNDKSNSGRSLLDLPKRTILLTILVSMFLCFILGNLFFEICLHMVKTDVEKTSAVEFITYPANHPNRSELLRAQLVDELLPDFKSQFTEASLVDSIISSEKFTVEELNKLSAQVYGLRPDSALGSRNITSQKDLLALVSGSLVRNWTTAFFPRYKQQPADSIADNCGLFMNYNSYFDGNIDNDSLAIVQPIRKLAIGSIQRIRDLNSKSIKDPARILQAIAGPLQWITFILAIWCLVMLFIRLRWAKLQTELIDSEGGPLSWLNRDNVHTWKLNIDSPLSTELRKEYGNLFVAPRFIYETLDLNNEPKYDSLKVSIQNRVQQLRESVEVGEYEIINFLIWAAPTFGFIGTIFGIISAMESASGIFEAGDQLQQTIALNEVSTALGTAFDTSFVALIWLVPMSFLLARTKKAEAQMFERLEYQATKHLIPQIIKKNALENEE